MGLYSPRGHLGYLHLPPCPHPAIHLIQDGCQDVFFFVLMSFHICITSWTPQSNEFSTQDVLEIISFDSWCQQIQRMVRIRYSMLACSELKTWLWLHDDATERGSRLRRTACMVIVEPLLSLSSINRQTKQLWVAADVVRRQPPTRVFFSKRFGFVFLWYSRSGMSCRDNSLLWN